MSTRAKRYWAAAPKSVFDEALTLDNGKVYYNFHGEETMASDSVGDVVRDLVARLGDESGMPESWMVFKYVPVPSSMHRACWAALNGDDSSMYAFKVRVHEKFEFPEVTRSGTMGEGEGHVADDLVGDDEQDRPADGVGEGASELSRAVDRALGVGSSVGPAATPALGPTWTTGVGSSVGDQRRAAEEALEEQLGPSPRTRD